MGSFAIVRRRHLNWTVGGFREATVIADSHKTDPSPGVELWLALGVVQDRNYAFVP